MPALVYLAYDPNAVRPGWIALGLVAALGVATYLLWRSMNTQLGNIQMPPKDPEAPFLTRDPHLRMPPPKDPPAPTRDRRQILDDEIDESGGSTAEDVG